jgi:hypothetical protein
VSGCFPRLRRPPTLRRSDIFFPWRELVHGVDPLFFYSPLPRLDRVDRLTAWTCSRDGFAVDCALQRGVWCEPIFGDETSALPGHLFLSGPASISAQRDVTDAGKATDISSFRERVIGRGRTHMRCCGNIARERHLDRCWDWASEQPA